VNKCGKLGLTAWVDSRLEIKYIIVGVEHLKLPRNGRIFEMINECTSNLLKHLEKTFSSMGGFKEIVVIFIWNYHYLTQLNRTKGRN
jgi:hypothetical protein